MEQRYNYTVIDNIDQEIDKAILGERISDVYMLAAEDLNYNGFPKGYKVEVLSIGSKGCIVVHIETPTKKVNYTRNYYGVGPLCYAQQNGQEFIICSTDYQCITIINLTTGERHTYGDKEAVEDGFGFCPVEARWDENNNRLFIVGCIWAFPYEQMVCNIPDLNHPEEGFNTAVYYDEGVDEE